MRNVSIGWIGEYMKRWMETRGIYDYPYLSWECDGHYSEVGQLAHADFAEIIVQEWLTGRLGGQLHKSAYTGTR